MDEDTNKKTLESYEQGVELYNAASLPITGSVKDWIDASLALLPSGAHILELGSAHGRDADYIETKGFKVDRTDAVQAFVDYLKSQNKDARLLNALTNDYGGPYDMIYANAVLLHFTPEQTKTVLQKVYNALKPHGLFSFSVKIGDDSAWSEAKLNAPRYFTYWREQPLKELLTDAHFDIVYWKEAQSGHTSESWYHVIARRYKY
jgi:SAM-dependent methyltransferase